MSDHSREPSILARAMGSCVVPFPRQFTVRSSTAEEAARFSARMKPGAQAITIIDHVDLEEIYVVAAEDAVVEDTDRCARILFRGQVR